ncbi:TonB-dependent receptor [Mucilaginibacter pallidiroseus]|uniref:TonB-dependent receptor n=1 Tax=Mucilaginibacter pallidiroseus TaxID=2599295 RepID=A0A563U0F2_9SPHI|nr:TonB-dependent receptor [Mucilaginibacter pallidiroseus]TWR25115.1 TonB-dependent receptor [Mucilaginibacter pallidiroseus]
MKKICALVLMLAACCTAFAQSAITGRVTGSKGEPINGALITLLNTNYATTTNQQGVFTLPAVQAGNYVVHVSSPGMAAVNINVLVQANTPPLKIQLTDASRQLDEVVVTAQKREEELQSVPASISTLSARQIQDYRVWNLKDITAIVPNLYSANPGDNRNVTGIRGIATTSYDPAVATYIDGVNQFSLDTYITQLFDVERVEVLRGPQGTLYGRNAMGGVINVITKQPTNTPGGFAEASYGSYGQQRYTLGYRTPLIKDKLYLGAAGLYTGMDGFYTNLFNNTKLDKQHSFTGNYYLKYLASNTFGLTLNVKHYANRNNGPFALAGSPSDALENPFKVSQNATTKMIDNIFNASLSANYTGSDFNFTSNTAYQQNYRYYTVPIDGDFSPADAVSVINNYGPNFNKVKVTTQEFRFSSPASATNWRWTAGLYGFYRYAPTKTGTYYGADAGLLGLDVTNITSINTNIERNYGTAVFGQVVYSITPMLDVTAGLRYDYEHKKNIIKGEYQPDGEPAIVTQNDTAAKAGFKAFTPKLSLAYHPSVSNNVYVSYSRGFRAGGISQLGSDPSQPPLYAFKPEYSDNFEIGSKNQLFDNRLRVNASLFYTNVNNAQVPTLILPSAITLTRNAGKLTSKGAELELAATVLNGLDIQYNFGYTHARYKSLVVAANGEAVNLTGNHQVYTPDVTSMLALQYACAIGSKTRLIARGEWRYLGDHYFDLANQIEQKAHSTYNARVGASWDRVSVFVWGSNLGNKRYLDYAYDFGASHLGNPRVYGVTLRTDF